MHDTRGARDAIDETYLWPQFATCSYRLMLPVWPDEKTEEQFRWCLNEAVKACESGWALA